MAIYFVLLAFPALMALFYPRPAAAGPGSPYAALRMSVGQSAAMIAFVTFYTLISLLRYEVGGDWSAYVAMYDQAASGTLPEAMTFTDPAFGLLLWLSSLMDLGIYPVDAICSLLLAAGIARVAATTREPWLAVVIAVPYLLIVVGMGYVRQAASIGLVLLAIGPLQRGKSFGTIVYLLLAMAFHSTSVVVWPAFALALANRNRLRILLIATVGSAGFLFVLASRLTRYEAGYIETEYESGGALVRLLMGMLPSLLLLARWRAFPVTGRARLVWLCYALAAVAAMVALFVVPSTTAVDRVALYFSAIQVVVFGNIGALTGIGRRSGLALRLMVILIAIAVQIVWLVFATYSEFWVPYKSLLGFL